MKLQQVAPRQGLVWVRKSLRVFARQPLGFASLLAAGLFVGLLFGLVPFVGPIGLLVLLPIGSLLFMIASRRVEEGQSAMPGSIVELARSGRANLVALLKLGLAYAVATFLVFWLAGVLDGGALESLLESLSDPKATPESAGARAVDPRLQFGLILRLLFGAALSIPFWHAPALVHWGHQPWAKSLFFSSVAIWRNKGAFTLYGLGWMGLWLMLLAIFSIGAGLFGQQRFALVATPLVLIFLTVFYASLWYTFADCFSSAGPAPASAGDDGDSSDPLTKGPS